MQQVQSRRILIGECANLHVHAEVVRIVGVSEESEKRRMSVEWGCCHCQVREKAVMHSVMASHPAVYVLIEAMSLA